MEVTDYANGTAPRSALIYFEGMWLSPDLYRRIKFVFEYVRKRGGWITGTEGYRWLGVQADRACRYSYQTSDKTPNQWFQKGRQARGETPAAAYPGTSEHGYGRSTDTNTNMKAVRDEAYALVGMKRNVASEDWHATIIGPPKIDLSAYSSTASGSAKPFPNNPTDPVVEEEEDEMPMREYWRREATGQVAVFGPGLKGRQEKDGPIEEGRFIFFTEQDYANHRAKFVVYNQEVDKANANDSANAKRGKLYVPPEKLTSIVGLTEGGWAEKCAEYGV